MDSERLVDSEYLECKSLLDCERLVHCERLVDREGCLQVSRPVDQYFTSVPDFIKKFRVLT